ncbi:hypothetical protein J4208_03770 [Candidatus Woesearchaeota archaeon]|nr:hypothetical protein [Candidatus Woesearchaeota archaeon]
MSSKEPISNGFIAGLTRLLRSIPTSADCWKRILHLLDPNPLVDKYLSVIRKVKPFIKKAHTEKKPMRYYYKAMSVLLIGSLFLGFITLVVLLSYIFPDKYQWVISFFIYGTILLFLYVICCIFWRGGKPYKPCPKLSSYLVNVESCFSEHRSRHTTKGSSNNGIISTPQKNLAKPRS